MKMTQPHSTQPHSTTRLADDQGSTEPEIDPLRKAEVTSQIRGYWNARNGETNAAPSLDLSCLYRHKSLVLSLVTEDYTRECEKSGQPVILQEFCRRYHGLGTPLENSIFRRLEVEEVINENPEAFETWHLFEWPEPGDTFLQFQVLEELGRGKFGRVYLCAQINLGGKTAVVKIESGKFVTEPALLGKLNHPNVMPIHWADYDESLNASFLCMPFFGRSTLADLVQLAFQDGVPTSTTVVDEASRLWLTESDSRVLEPVVRHRRSFFPSSYVNKVIDLASDLAKALAFVHDQEIIHGDIKPSNVLLSSAGQPLLMDFNLGRSGEFYEGHYGGTPAYMAPEQLRILGDPLPPSQLGSGVSTDIYSFGAVLYELLTGKPPLDPPAKRQELVAVVQELIGKQRNGLPDMRTLNPHVDQRLEELVKSCLEFIPADRPASMREVVERLMQYRGVIGGSRRYAQQKPKRTWLFGLGVVGVACMASTSYLSRPPLAQRFYNQAISARATGDWESSISYLNKVLAEDPNYYGARLDRARCSIELQEYTLALGDLGKLVKATNDPTAMAYYGYVFNHINNPDSAVLWYQNALEEGLRNSAVLNNLGLSLLRQSKPLLRSERIALAAPVLEEALRLDPESATIRINILRLHQMSVEQNAKDAKENAAENVQWLTTKMPDHADAWHAIHRFYFALAKRGLMDPSEVTKAEKKYHNASIRTTISRFLDPFSAGDPG